MTRPVVVRDVLMRNNLTIMEKCVKQLDGVGDDAQLAMIDLQNMLQKQQQIIQMLSNISKALDDNMMAVIRNMK